MSERILVTGGAGFIGSAFIRHLLKTTDYEILSLDRLDEAGTYERLAALHAAHAPRLQCFFHDIKAPVNPAHHSWLRGPIKWVVHMAAGSHVDRSIRDPLSFVADNCLGTANMLEYVRAHLSPEKFLYFGTDENYGAAPDGESFDEYDRWWPTNPYSASKSAGEALCPAWANTYAMPITISHCTNAIGEFQMPEKFVPLVTGKVLRGETVQIHARDSVPSSRCYVHVDNIAAAVLTILNRGGIIGGPGTGVYNISGAEELSNLFVAERIAAILGKPLRHELVEFVANRPRPDQRYAIKGERLRALGWEPHITFEEGLERAVRWEAGRSRAPHHSGAAA